MYCTVQYIKHVVQHSKARAEKSDHRVGDEVDTRWACDDVNEFCFD